jgi:TolA-binding protein/tRNA A-37 threonylcarbamoyl transferase component Bud32
MVGQTLSHYRILEKLGEGASAVVYKADDLSLGRAVVVKVVSPDLSMDPATLTRFEHEARTASSLNHPNICTVYEINQHQGCHFIVMERLEGEELSRVIRRAPVDPYRAIELVIQIADALDAAHAERILHRDLKPANIFVSERDQVKLLDFGLAMLLPAGRQTAPAVGLRPRPTVGGTVPYMSPEQTRGEELDARSDLFAVGVVMYEMLTACRPFSGSDSAAVLDAIARCTPVPMRDLNPAVSPELERIVSKALEKNRKLRFQTASDLRADLLRLKRDLDSTTTLLPARPDAPASASRISAHRVASHRWRSAGQGVRRVVAGTAIGLGLLVLATVAFEAMSARGAAQPAAPETFAAATLGSVDDVVLPAAAASVVTPPAPLPERSPSDRVAVAAPAAGSVAIVPVEAPAPAESGAAEWAKRELAVARAKLDAKLYDQALVTLRTVAAAQDAGPAGVEAHFLIASVHEQQQQFEDAMAAYVEIVHRFPDDPRAPEGLFQMAQNTLRTRRPDRQDEARRLFTQAASGYPQSSWAPRALVARGELEERERLYQHDDVLGASVPAALVTYREVVGQYASSAPAEIAHWRMAQILIDLKRYELAAQTLSGLATTFPDTRYDAWFTAGEVFDRRLHDRASAAAAYARVPRSSPRFNDAQKRLR